MPFLETAGRVSLHYHDWGPGEQHRGRPLVLIQWLAGACRRVEYQAGFLAEHGHRVITYNRRGFGRS